MRYRLHGSDGETLLEVLAAVIILGFAGLAVLVGVGVGARTSDINRKQSTDSSYAHSYAEYLEQWVATGHYTPCAPAHTYDAATVGFVVPQDLSGANRYKATQGTAAHTWNPATSTWVACTADTGTQQVLLTVTSTDTEASRVATETLYVVLRKPCPTASAPC